MAALFFFRKIKTCKQSRLLKSVFRPGRTGAKTLLYKPRIHCQKRHFCKTKAPLRFLTLFFMYDASFAGGTARRISPLSPVLRAGAAPACFCPARISPRRAAACSPAPAVPLCPGAPCFCLSRNVSPPSGLSHCFQLYNVRV